MGDALVVALVFEVVYQILKAAVLNCVGYYFLDMRHEVYFSQ